MHPSLRFSIFAPQKQQKRISPLALPFLLMGALLTSPARPATGPWWATYDFASKGVVAIWTFDGDPEDKTANANNGAWLSGTGSYVEGVFGDAYQFADGSWFQVDGATSLESFNQGTLAAWLRLDSALGAEYLLGKGSDLAGGTSAAYRLFVQASGFNFSGWTDNQELWNSGQVSIASWEGWHHLAGTWDGITARAYFDGILVAENSDNPVGITTTLPNHPLYINRHDFSQGSSSRLTGTIDEPVIFSRALSGKEISALASDTNGDNIADFWTGATVTNVPAEVLFDDFKYDCDQDCPGSQMFGLNAWLSGQNTVSQYFWNGDGSTGNRTLTDQICDGILELRIPTNFSSTTAASTLTPKIASPLCFNSGTYIARIAFDGGNGIDEIVQPFWLQSKRSCDPLYAEVDFELYSWQSNIDYVLHETGEETCKSSTKDNDFFGVSGWFDLILRVEPENLVSFEIVDTLSGIPIVPGSTLSSTPTLPEFGSQMGIFLNVWLAEFAPPTTQEHTMRVDWIMHFPRNPAVSWTDALNLLDFYRSASPSVARVDTTAVFADGFDTQDLRNWSSAMGTESLETPYSFTRIGDSDCERRIEEVTKK